MAAYVIGDIDVHDPAGYEPYKAASLAAITQYGGRFLARGGACQTLEGDWEPKRIVVIEFESVDQARRWWDSPEYHAARQIRQAAARARFIVVEGA